MVSITANPGTNIAPGTSVTFTANVTNGGASPFYLWKKNNAGIPGATNSTYTTNMIATGDGFSVQVLSSDPCASPAQSNVLSMQVTNSIARVDKKEPFVIHPNPFIDAITVNGPADNSFDIRLTDVTGKVIYENKNQKAPAVIVLDIAPGIYFYKIESSGRSQTGKLRRY